MSFIHVSSKEGDTNSEYCFCRSSAALGASSETVCSLFPKRSTSSLTSASSFASLMVVGDVSTTCVAVGCADGVQAANETVINNATANIFFILGSFEPCIT